ncbi:Flocculation protein FLO11-like [Caenorhabditis elegans]|uniref:Flocculation protein FLO11-like n=1 Tax=Caenorhabditis elegans TaxID=6239 RepID=Q95XV0_CAEEL|nr:Flocculation protein FLO11-like [Caenorhabditis elegans]CCD72908.1 Flocculation protein FLO11-like [Caenorhabditis elegans]|eukprot:NP_504756.3 Uncharacterized protein CELE_Y57E12B.4 [Caenorhabditis elegans]
MSRLLVIFCVFAAVFSAPAPITIEPVTENHFITQVPCEILEADLSDDSHVTPFIERKHSTPKQNIPTTPCATSPAEIDTTTPQVSSSEPFTTSENSSTAEPFAPSDSTTSINETQTTSTHAETTPEIHYTEKPATLEPSKAPTDDCPTTLVVENKTLTPTEHKPTEHSTTIENTEPTTGRDRTTDPVISDKTETPSTNFSTVAENTASSTPIYITKVPTTFERSEPTMGTEATTDPVFPDKTTNFATVSEHSRSSTPNYITEHPTTFESSTESTDDPTPDVTPVVFVQTTKVQELTTQTSNGVPLLLSTAIWAIVMWL